MPLRVLILEDRPSDVELVLYALRSVGFDPSWEVVDTEQAYLERLTPDLDIILSDYRMPQFEAPRALQLLQERGWDIPFIIVSGTIGEEQAVAAIKRGATDYLLKDRLGRLGQAVSRALEEKRLRDEKRRAGEALKESEERYRSLFDNVPVGLYRTTPEGKILNANSALVQMLGYEDRDSLLAADARDSYVDLSFREQWRSAVESEGLLIGYQKPLKRKDGRVIWVEENSKAFRDDQGRVLYYEGSFQDITARKRAEEALRNTLEKLRKSLTGTVQAMAHTVESRDPYTSGHQQRVAKLARAIATEMGLQEGQVEGIFMAGLIHDVGKISVPAEILSKPGRLSQLEFELIKTHPQVGDDVLRGIEFPWPIAQVVLQHHERMNGSGYPQGLLAEQILREARVLAVADVVEAMMSHRPYRPALGIDSALEEISKNREVLYDPDAVDACLRLFREKGFVFG